MLTVTCSCCSAAASPNNSKNRARRAISFRRAAATDYRFVSPRKNKNPHTRNTTCAATAATAFSEFGRTTAAATPRSSDRLNFNPSGYRNFNEFSILYLDKRKIYAIFICIVSRNSAADLDERRS
nr:hypothetical protein [Cribrihabitans marinus]